MEAGVLMIRKAWPAGCFQTRDRLKSGSKRQSIPYDKTSLAASSIAEPVVIATHASPQRQPRPPMGNALTMVRQVRLFLIRHGETVDNVAQV